MYFSSGFKVVSGGGGSRMLCGRGFREERIGGEMVGTRGCIKSEEKGVVWRSDECCCCISIEVGGL